MAQKSLQYPQITEDQLEIWLSSSVTQTYLQCLNWFLEDVKDEANDDKLVDSSNSDLTFANIHVNMGHKQGLRSAMDYKTLMNRLEMIEPKKEAEPDKEVSDYA